MEFSYRVRDSNGQIKTGSMEADNDMDVVSKLQNMGFLVLDVLDSNNKALSNKKENETVAFKHKVKRRKKLKIEELILFFDQFSVLVDASVDMMKSLDILAMQAESEQLYLTVSDIKKQVGSGLNLSKAMSKYPKVFTNFMINLIEIGETGGILGTVTQKIAEHLEKKEEVKSKLKSALIYPSLLVSLSIMAIVAFLFKIIPTFEDIFKNSDLELPALTKMVINLSHFAKDYIVFEIIIIIVIIILVKFMLATPQYRYKIDKNILQVPLLGDLLFKTAIVNFSISFSVLLSNGVPIITAIDMMRSSIGNMFLQDVFRRIREKVKSGNSISKEIENSQVFPPLVTQMIGVGEESGKLVEMLNKIAEFYEKRVTVAVKNFTTAFEPIILIIMGIIIGILVIAMFLPMFKLTQMKG